MVHRFPLPYYISPGESQAVPEVNIPSLKASTSKWQTSCQMTPICTTKSISGSYYLCPHTPLRGVKLAFILFLILTRVILDPLRTFQIVQHQERHFHPALSGCCQKQLWMKEVQNSSMEAVNFLQTWLRFCCGGELHKFLAFSKAKRSHVSCNSAELCAMQNTIENCFYIPAEVELR